MRSDLIYDKDRVPDREFICSWQLTECQLEYFGLVRELVEEVDTGDVDVLYRSWCRALEFANEPAIWSTIELVAETLEHQQLSFERSEQSDRHFELELPVPARHCCAWLQHRDNNLEIFKRRAEKSDSSKYLRGVPAGYNWPSVVLSSTVAAAAYRCFGGLIFRQAPVAEQR